MGSKAIAICLLASHLAAASAEPPVPSQARQRELVLGVLPFMSPIALFERFAPLRDYLAEQTGRPVVLETAHSYPEFVRRTEDRKYDVLLTAPHFVLLAVDSGSYRVRATYAQPLSAVVLIHAEGPVREVADLAGRIVATPPPEAIVTIIGRHMLTRRGLSGDRAPLYRNCLSHNAAYQAVIGGEAAAAIVSVNLAERATDASSSLRALTQSEQFPALGILTAADLPEALQGDIASTFTGMRQHARGRAVLRRISYPGYRAATAQEFEPLRPYLSVAAPLAGEEDDK